MPLRLSERPLVSLLLTALGVTLWTLVFFWQAFSMPFFADEGEYAYAAWLLHTGHVPYAESFMQKPPMVIYTYYAAQLISPSEWPVRTLMMLMIVLALLLLGSVAERLHSRYAAYVVYILGPPLLALPELHSFLALPELFMLTPLALSLSLLLYKTEHTYRYALISGACLAVALWYKPTVFGFVVVALTYALVRAYKDGSWYRVLAEASLVTAGGLLISLIVVLPIALKGGLSAMWESAFVYNSLYAGTTAFNPDLFSYCLPTVYLVYAVCSIVGVLILLPRHIWMIFVFAACFLGAAGSCQMHYYIITLPALLILIALCCSEIAARLSIRHGLPTIILVCSIAFFAALPPVLADTHAITQTPNDRLARAFGESFIGAKFLGTYLHNTYPATSKIFIYGNHPEILYYSKLLSVTPFVILYPLEYVTTVKMVYQKRVMADLTAHPPDLIVTPGIIEPVRKPSADYGFSEFMGPFILREYALAGTVSGTMHDGFTMSTTSVPLYPILYAVYERQ